MYGCSLVSVSLIVLLIGVCCQVCLVLLSDADGMTSWTDKGMVELIDWKAQGSYTTVYNRNMFYIDIPCTVSADRTFVFIHGFPSSSFDYHRVLNDFAAHGRVILYDHIGFGFSDKPDASDTFAYSIQEHADYTLDLLRQLNVDNVTFVAHDMGDSVLTEILTRRDRDLLPVYYDNHHFTNVVFTNGGMIHRLINFRITQRILLWCPGAMTLTSMLHQLGLSEILSRQQLGTLWGNSLHMNKTRDIEHLIAGNQYKNGMLKTPLSIKYLLDRFQYEPQWLDALTRVNVPVCILWSDADAVSPLQIQHLIGERVPSHHLTTLVLPDAGHFLMLEDPQGYTRAILNDCLHLP